MTKAQREKARRVMLDHMLDSNPKWREIIDNLIDNPKPEIVNAVKPVIEEALKKERMTGVNIGFYGGLIQSYEKIKDMEKTEDIKKLLLDEANKVKNKFGLKEVEQSLENKVG